jgi:hypothetical protein
LVPFEELADALAQGGVVLDEEEGLDLAGDELLDLEESAVEVLLVGGLGEEAHGAALVGVEVLVGDGHDVDGDVAGVGVVFEGVEHLPAGHAGQVEVEDDGVGWVGLDQIEAGLAVGGEEALEALLVGVVVDYFGEAGVVLDDEQDAVARLGGVPVVGHDLRGSATLRAACGAAVPALTLPPGCR